MKASEQRSKPKGGGQPEPSSEQREQPEHDSEQAAIQRPEPGRRTEFLRTVGLAPAVKPEPSLNRRSDQLRRRRVTLKDRRSRQESRMSAFMVFAAGFILLAPFIDLLGIASWRYVGYFEAYGLILLCGAFLASGSARKLTRDIAEVNNEIDLDEIAKGLVDRDNQAARLHQVSQVDLKRYYDQTLRQGDQIFYVGVACIVLGFVVIGVSLWLIQDETTGLSEQIVVGTLGAIGGILANFIAVIYVRMFSETVKSVSDFHARLVMCDRTNFGNILAAKIDEAALREQTLANMAVQLVGDHTTGSHRNGANHTKEPAAASEGQPGD